MRSDATSKTSAASIIFRVGIAILILAALALWWILNSGDSNIFTGLFLVLIFILVIPSAAIVLLVSGLLGSAEMVQARKAKKNASPAAEPNGGEQAVDDSVGIHE